MWLSIHRWCKNVFLSVFWWSHTLMVQLFFIHFILNFLISLHRLLIRQTTLSKCERHNTISSRMPKVNNNNALLLFTPSIYFFFNFMNVFNFYVLTVWCDWYNRRVKWSMWQRQCSRCTRSMLLRTTVSWWWTCAVETTVRSSGTLRWKTSAESQGRRWTR